MKVLIPLLLFMMTAACRSSNKVPVETDDERYKLAPELSESGKKNHDYYWQKSKDWIEINTETGDFKGSFKETGFAGNFVIKKTSGGFAKGFYYTVELGFLEKEAETSKQVDAFFDQIVKAQRLYFYPDRLNNPAWINLEISEGPDTKILKFILKKV